MLKIINIFSLKKNKKLQNGESSFFQQEMWKDTVEIIYFNTDDFNENALLQASSCQKTENIVIFKESVTNLNKIFYQCFLIFNIEVVIESDAYISQQISDKRKVFDQVRSAFSNADIVEMLRLPLKTFQSDAWESLQCLMGNISSDFKKQFEKLLKDIKSQHRRPQRRSYNKKKSYYDSRKLYFELGKEHHAQHETGGSHNGFCDLLAKYRFGCKINCLTHYNVCKENSNNNRLTITLENCHNEQKEFHNRTHLNVFSNDYIT